MNGVLNIYKEAGYTSHDVVAKLRGIVKQKKIGHTGTLDPDAEGVLPVCLGNATKLCGMLTEKEKTYEAILLLGQETDTQDTSGRVLSSAPVTVSEEAVREAVLSFLGSYEQIPPMYSALKVNGKKLYELAREGKEVERKARKVQIHEISIQWIRLPEVCFTVTCSSGTYIRTLCYDIGRLLGCGGCMKRLLRTRVSQFELKDSLRLSQVEAAVKEGSLAEYLIPVERVLEAYPAVIMKAKADRLLYNGNPFSRSDTEREGEKPEESGRFRVYDSQERFQGIYRYEAGLYRPVKMFLGEGKTNKGS